jgi:AraC-like DNA-binding protein
MSFERIDHAVVTMPAAMRGITVMNAVYRRQRFAPHAHDTYTLGVVTEGGFSFRCGNRRWVAPSGSVCLINPGEIHTGESTSVMSGWAYWNAYIPIGLVRRMVIDEGCMDFEMPEFEASVINDRTAYRALLSFLSSTQLSEPLTMESRLFEALSVLLRSSTMKKPVSTRIRAEPSIVGRAREYMAANFAEPLTLTEIAESVGVCGPYLDRLFRSNTGLAVHAWLVQYRLQKATEQLLLGAPIPDTAACCGFSDQAHLTRWVKRVLGITPNQLRRMSGLYKWDEINSQILKLSDCGSVGVRM